MTVTRAGWSPGRGIDRLLARETNVSDLVQFLSMRDSSPWESVVGFRPDRIEREERTANHADLLLLSGDRKAVVEVKLGHVMDDRQQKSYEALGSDHDLYFVALAADEARLAVHSDRWTFLSLTRLLGQWRTSADDLARPLAEEAARVTQDWDERISGVFERRGTDESRPLEVLNRKFVARVVSRRVAVELGDRYNEVVADVMSGNSGLPLVVAWSPILGYESDRYFMAEVRWTDSPAVGELRFGVDFYPSAGPDRDSAREEDEGLRRAAFDLAHRMDLTIRFPSLQEHLTKKAPGVEPLLYRKGRDRPAASGDWEQVMTHGLAGASSRAGKKLTRRNCSPGFFGDKALRFQAIANIDFSEASAHDLIDLIDSTLSYLREREPKAARGSGTVAATGGAIEEGETRG